MPLESQPFIPIEGLADSELRLRVPYLSEYFGVWAVREEDFRLTLDGLKHFHLHEHMRAARADSPEIQARSRGEYPVADGVAVIELRGPLMKHVSSMSDGSSTVLARSQIRKAVRDPAVNAILLHVDSPGGTVSGTKDLADDVAKAAAHKPTHAYIEDLGASAAYWMASQASKITTNDTGLVGSIGTFAVLYDMSKLAEQEGIAVHIVRAGDFKGMGTPGTEITPEQLAEAQRIVSELNDHFLNAVAKGRGISLAGVRQLADGRVHVGGAALSQHLVDGVGTIDAALAAVREESGKTTRASVAVSDEIIQSESEDPTMSETTPEKKAATLQELQAACEGAEPAFILDQLSNGATVVEAVQAHNKALQAQLEAARKEREAAAAKEKSDGAKTLGNGGNLSADDSAAGFDDPLGEFNRLVNERMSNGTDRSRAIAAVAAADPNLHRSFLLATNDSKFAQRVIGEKYDF